MPRTMYQTCVVIMHEVKKNGYHEQISGPDLMDIIRHNAGSSELTKRRYRKELCETGFLKTTNSMVFKIIRFPEGQPIF